MDGIESNRVELVVDDEPVGVRYLVGGAGPPMVFLHGIGLDAATVSWRYALPALAEDYRVYAPDFPGHGESDKPDRQYTTEYYVNALRAFREGLGIEGGTLVGLSMGGAVALGYTLSGGDPERLVLVDSYGLGGDAYWRGPASVGLRVPFVDQLLWGSVGTRVAVRASLRQLAGDGSEPPSDLVDDVRSVTTPETVRTLRRWQRHEFRADGFRTDYTGRLDEIEVPTLLLHGADDPLFPVEWSQQASEALPTGEVRVFEGCGHWPPRELPDRFNRAVRAF